MVGYTTKMNRGGRIAMNKTEELKHLARNPTGFRRWDEWLGVIEQKNRRDYGDSSLILVTIVALSEKPFGFRQRVVHEYIDSYYQKYKRGEQL